MLLRWMEQVGIAPVHPVPLIFAVRALTQHHADFGGQERAVQGKGEADPFPEADRFLETLFRRLPAPAQDRA